MSDLRKIQVEEMERCREWIEGALKVYDTHDFEDIVVGVLNGKFDFWSAPDACIVIFCSLPVPLSLADTLKIPFASISNVTSI